MVWKRILVLGPMAYDEIQSLLLDFDSNLLDSAYNLPYREMVATGSLGEMDHRR